MDVIESLRMNAGEIKNLRLRLGWTHADLARRVACSADEVKEWEDGLKPPHREALNQLQYLLFKADSLAHDLAAQPQVESTLMSYHLEQISADQWRDLVPEPPEAES